ncbi:hypothetical protein WJX84_010805 [Apatococcus fuscideae]|uniref:Uncharacterized protein n=1 Tax=Apatococcus fuscideae TaxID=2026836 RepID=A0AAW1STN6_9CHLO
MDQEAAVRSGLLLHGIQSAGLSEGPEEEQHRDARLFTDQQQAQDDFTARKAAHAAASGGENAAAATRPSPPTEAATPSQPHSQPFSLPRLAPLRALKQQWGRMRSLLPGQPSLPEPARPSGDQSASPTTAAAAPASPMAVLENGPMHPASTGQARPQTLADLVARSEPSWAPIDLSSGLFMAWWLAFTGLRLISPNPEVLSQLRKDHPLPDLTAGSSETRATLSPPAAEVQSIQGETAEEKDRVPMVLEALPAEGAEPAELPTQDALVYTVPGLAVSMPTALGPGRYLPVFLSERQRDAALEAGARMMLGNHMALQQELRQTRCLLAIMKATTWAGLHTYVSPLSPKTHSPSQLFMSPSVILHSLTGT